MLCSANQILSFFLLKPLKFCTKKKCQNFSCFCVHKSANKIDNNENLQNLYAVKGVFLDINIRLFIHFLQMPFIHAYIYLWTFREGNMSFDNHSIYDEDYYWFLTSRKRGGSIIYFTIEYVTVYFIMYFITLTFGI